MKKPLKHNGKESDYTVTKKGKVKRIFKDGSIGMTGGKIQKTMTDMFFPNGKIGFDSLDLRAIADYMDKIDKS